MANKGKIPLEMIEVQTGSYHGEDDRRLQAGLSASGKTTFSVHAGQQQ